MASDTHCSVCFNYFVKWEDSSATAFSDFLASELDVGLSQFIAACKLVAKLIRLGEYCRSFAVVDCAVSQQKDYNFDNYWS